MLTSPTRTALTLRLITLPITLCILFLMLWIQITGEVWFLFFVWNLFLALVPVGLSKVIAQQYSTKHRITLLMNVLFVVWLLFLPNTFYMVTDFIHLRDIPPEYVWLGFLTIASFAITGMMFGLVSVRTMQLIVRDVFSKRAATVFVAAVLFLASIGIYLGRFIRFNSWDVVSSPDKITEYTLTALVHWQSRIDSMIFIVPFSVLLIAIYFVVYTTAERIEC